MGTSVEAAEFLVKAVHVLLAGRPACGLDVHAGLLRLGHDHGALGWEFGELVTLDGHRSDQAGTAEPDHEGCERQNLHRESHCDGISPGNLIL